jgi:hypothetical protein
VYRHGNNISLLLVGVYVDDLIITSVSRDRVEKFKSKMKALDHMSDLGLLCFYLGIEVRQGDNSITLQQGHYAKRILELAGMGGCPVHTPMEEWLKLSQENTAETVDPTHYWQIVGNLCYLVHT